MIKPNGVIQGGHQAGMVFVAWTSFILQKAGFLHSSIVRVRALLLSHFFSSFIFLERTFYIVLRVFTRTGRPFATQTPRPKGLDRHTGAHGIHDHNLSRVVNSAREEETHTYLYI